MLSVADKERARYHLGYMDVAQASSFAFAIPQATQPQFLFESSIQRVQPWAEPRVLRLLDTLDKIECRLMEASGDLFARRAGDLEFNLEQPTDLEREYVRWACRLADIIGVMPYPFSEKFRILSQGGIGGSKAGIVPVRR
jgi:hypothetical protein